MILFTFCAAICILMVQAIKINEMKDLNFEPKLALQCGRIAKYVDVSSGLWKDSDEEVCSSDPHEVLKFCKKTYPDIEITNIVEANENVTICSGKDCMSSYSVLPYRCLVGAFEADALSYPTEGQCNFGYVHESKTCYSHDYWHGRASFICQNKGKSLIRYGILLPCDVDMFTGVEYVCCKKTDVQTPTKSLDSNVDSGVLDVSKTNSDSELEDLLKKFAAHIPTISKGCKRSKYNTKSDLLLKLKNDKVRDLTKKLNEAKARMEELKKDDPEQAKAMYKKSLNIFESTLKNIESQGKLDQLQLSQEKKECVQMNLNHKKHIAMNAFINAVRNHQDKPGKIIKAFHRFMNVLQSDQDANMHSFSKKLLGKGPKMLITYRDLFLSHLNIVKTPLREAVKILKHINSVHGKIDFNLPPFAMDIDFEFAHKPKTTAPPPTTAPVETKPLDSNEDDGTLGLDKDEQKREHEHDSTSPTEDLPVHNGMLFGMPHASNGKQMPHVHHDHPIRSRAVFAAIIGLSCGALVIMVVIVLALFVRKSTPKKCTKTVIADDDDNSQEKRHLLKMQEDGFENPTYKFFAN